MIKKNTKALRALLDAAGIKKGRPRAKADLINYLCILGKNAEAQRCDPLEGEFCDGDLVCDVGTKLCIPPKFVRPKLHQMVWGGRTIIGTKTALKKLKTKLKPIPPSIPPPATEVEAEAAEVEAEAAEAEAAEVEVEVEAEAEAAEVEAEAAEVEAEAEVEAAEVEAAEVESSEELDCKDTKFACQWDLDCEPCGDGWWCGNNKLCQEGPKPTTKLKEGTPVLSTEEILRKLEKDGKVDVDGMTAVQREVLSCLGLLS